MNIRLKYFYLFTYLDVIIIYPSLILFYSKMLSNFKCFTQ